MEVIVLAGSRQQYCKLHVQVLFNRHIGGGDATARKRTLSKIACDSNNAPGGTPCGTLRMCGRQKTLAAGE